MCSYSVFDDIIWVIHLCSFDNPNCIEIWNTYDLNSELIIAIANDQIASEFAIGLQKFKPRPLFNNCNDHWLWY